MPSTTSSVVSALLRLFDGDDAFFADLLHGFGEELADRFVAVGADGADLGDLFRILGLLGALLQRFDDGLDGLVDAALDLHRVVPGGDELGAFAVDGLGENGGGGRAVAGDVATSCEATSCTICAPMFSKWFSSSISLATVTPSLVMVGAPKLFSMTTLRPLGPRVTLTASASALTPGENEIAGIFGVDDFFGCHLGHCS